METRVLDLKLISNRLKEHRINIGLSREEVRDRLVDYSIRQIYSFEENLQEPTLLYLIDFCNHLDADIDYIIGYIV